ncbi:autotransporter outer membrane beta-barrel domain-containing protein [Campylobacter ureolyticus]|uniref:autotransporter outer membrane beta-barrel domain-containing protein n=1 Tax=Campylobacter ureolyticus TaxID=827 RepID=UPI0022B2F5A0|nr:autotransporter outer membrane beta-barrel domain-containing protein [Campylobacter ureolyticus]MCZ6149957.1 autotransporter outer membrane beta-barrel domain-containing protein [Campylobacter ureolyticus]
MQKNIFLKVLVLLLGTQMSLSAKSIIPHFTTGLDDNHSYQIGVNWLWLKQKSPNSFSNNIDGSNHDGLTTKTKNGDYIDKNLLKKHITEIENEKLLLSSGYEIPHFLAKNKSGGNELKIINFDPIGLAKDIIIKKPSYENNNWNLKDMLPKTNSTNPFFDIPVASPVFVPNVNKPKPINNININLVGSGVVLYSDAYYLNTKMEDQYEKQSNFSQVTFEKGTFLKISPDFKDNNFEKRNDGILKIKDYQVTKPLFYNEGELEHKDPSEEGSTDIKKDMGHFLNAIRTAPYTKFKKGVKIYTDSKSYNPESSIVSNGYDREYGFTVVMETYPNEEYNYNLYKDIINFETADIGKINDKLANDEDKIDDNLPYFMPKDLEIGEQKDKSKVPLVYFENEGTVEIADKAKGFLMTVVNLASNKLYIANNKGSIVLLPRYDEDQKAAVFFYSPDIGQEPDTKEHIINVNTGDINLFGSHTMGFLATAAFEDDYGGSLKDSILSFINDGNLIVNGAKSIGIAIAGDKGDLGIGSNVHAFKPITLRGDETIGFYNENNALNKYNKSFNTMKIIIADKGNETDDYKSKIANDKLDIKEDGEEGKIFKSQSNTTGNDERSVDNAIAIVYDANKPSSVMDLAKTDIQINANSTNGIGIYAKNGTIKLSGENNDAKIIDSFDEKIVNKINENFKNDTNHVININGGKNNVALYSANDESEIMYNGNININGGKDFEGKESTDNRAILATDQGKIEFQGKLNVGKDGLLITSNAVVYSDDAEVTIKDSTINMYLADNSNGFYALNPTNTNPQNSQPQIKIEENVEVNLNGNGVGIAAGNGGHIDLSGANIKATGLKSALASIGNTSYINAENATITYDGDSYATYSSQKKAKINLNNATIKLMGNSYGIALDYDKANKTYDVKGLMGKVKIEPLSDKANLFTIKGYKDLKTSLFKDEGGALNLQDTIGDFSYEIDRSDPNGRKATLALIDGLENFTIDSDIDKSLAGQRGDKISDMKNDDEKIAFNFAKNIKIQRAKITLDSGKKVEAVMNEDELKNLSMSKPFAIAVSAGPNATKKDETSITLKNNSKVIVDSKVQKEDAGVGLYIDFGKVNTDKGSSIKVGSSNTKKATGIYAVSSDVTNDGTIQTDSSLSIGAMLYAQNPEQPYSQTFIDHIGGTSELKSSITNNGDIVVTGERSAGIYVDNNLNKDKNAYTAVNNKSINVKAAKSIAMASSNSTLTNKGNINLNEKSDSSIAMYGKEFQDEKQTTNSISTLKNSGRISINSNHSAGMLNKSVNNDSSTQLLNGGEIISSKNTSKVTAISGKNIDVENGSKIDLRGKNSVGIYADNSSDVNVEENAKISIGDDSIILYSKSDDNTNIDYNIKNTEISGKNQTAIYLENSKENVNKLILTSNSVFDVKGEDSKALHLKSIGNPSNYTFDDITFNLKGKNNVAVLAEGSTNVSLGANSKINMDELAYGSIGLALQDSDNKTITIANKGTINVAKSDKDNKIYSAAIALFSPGIAINKGTINTDDESVGMYGIDNEKIKLQNENEININKNAVAMYIKNGAATNSGNININGENGVGMYAKKGSLINSGEILASSQGAGMFSDEDAKISNLNKILLNNENSVGIYTKNEAVNKGNISLLGDSSVGIFAKNILNEGVIDLNSKGENDKFSAALVGENIINKGTINLNKKYEVGMYGIGTSTNKAVLTNDGAINLNANNQIGMYAKFADVKNSGDININAQDSIGIYADNSVIDNTGKITLNADNSVGVYMINGSYFKNRGEIKIIGNSKSVVKDDEEINIALPGITSFRPNEVHKDKFKGVDIEVNKNTQNFEDFNVKYDNKIYNTQNSVKLSNSQIANNLDLSFLNKTTNIEIPKNLDNKSKKKRVKKNIVAMYADTSGVKLTKPIKGLGNLNKNDKIILYIGAEAANYTNERVINLDQSLMKPFIDELDESTATKAVYSGSLTWQAFATFDKNAKNNHKIKSFVMSKIPYVNFITKDSKYKDLYIALDKKYEKAIVGSNDKKIFNKLNLLGKNEEFNLHKNLKSLGGFEYASTQTRAYSSADIYDREFNDLMRWDTNTTDTTKFKIFGANTKRNQRVDGVLGYDKNAYGLFVLNNFDLKMDGTSNGVFGGIAKERYEFNNDYKSKEDALTAQIGYYVDRKVLNEEVNHLLKIAATGSAREMKRYTLNKDFWAKSKYYTLGFDVKNSFYKEYKFDSGFKISPYAGVDLGYGIIENIKEKSGNTLLLDVDSKDYYSIRPNLGIELGYTHLLDENSYFNILLDSKIYKEFGKINRANNLARFKDTNSYFSLPKEDKEDKGAEFTLVGKYENGNFGASLKGGYQTQFKDRFIGLDLRIKF